MKLTPLEIRKQEFRKALRGFDAIEVQTFLEMVAEQYEELLEDNNSLNRRVIELETKLQDYQQNEKNLRETLLNVQEVKKQSEESSRKQADLIVKEAELKALEILESARKQTRQIKEEVSWLKSQKESFINRLRHILISQIELLSVMEIDDVLPEESQEAVKSMKSSRSPQHKKSKLEDNKAKMDTPGIEALEKDVKDDKGAGDEQNELIEVGAEITDLTKGIPSEKEERVIQQISESETEKGGKKQKNKSKNEPSLTEDDINDYFKKGLQIDELIKTINKKDVEK